MLLWWHYCAIIFTSGLSLSIGIGGIVFTVNYTCDKDFLENRLNCKKIKLEQLKLQKDIEKNKQEHDQKMIGC